MDMSGLLRCDRSTRGGMADPQPTCSDSLCFSLEVQTSIRGRIGLHCIKSLLLFCGQELSGAKMSIREKTQFYLPIYVPSIKRGPLLPVHNPAA